MKLRKRLIAAFAASTLLLSTGSAFAFGGDHHGKGHHDGKPLKRLLRGVDLTDEQKEQLKTLKMEQKEARKNNVIGGRDNMLSQREQVKQLLLADNFDEQSVRLLAEEMVNQQTERRVAMLKSQHAMLSVLTPEQKQQVSENMTKMQKRMEEKLNKRLRNN